MIFRHVSFSRCHSTVMGDATGIVLPLAERTFCQMCTRQYDRRSPQGRRLSRRSSQGTRKCSHLCRVFTVTMISQPHLPRGDQVRHSRRLTHPHML